LRASFTNSDFWADVVATGCSICEIFGSLRPDGFVTDFCDEHPFSISAIAAMNE
jgi:hypothetical protein